MAITGKVAKILNARELIINQGSEAGVELEMEFKVFEERVDIMDPDTGDSLGTLDMEKIRIKISDVHPRFAIGRTFETYQTRPSLLDPSYLRALTSGGIRKVRTLRTQGDATVTTDENVAKVSPGDPVVHMEGGINAKVAKS